MCEFCMDSTCVDGLTPDNDLSFMPIGETQWDARMFYRAGNGKPNAIVVEILGFTGWETVGVYNPKYCPECGRPLTGFTPHQADPL